MAVCGKNSSHSSLKNEKEFFNTLEIQQKAGKAEEIFSKCSVAFEEKIHERESFERTKKKI